MASPETNLSSFDYQAVKPINALLSSSSNLDYNSLENATVKFPKIIFFVQSQDISEIKNLTPAQQDIIVRDKLIELKNWGASISEGLILKYWGKRKHL